MFKFGTYAELQSTVRFPVSETKPPLLPAYLPSRFERTLPACIAHSRRRCLRAGPTPRPKIGEQWSRWMVYVPTEIVRNKSTHASTRLGCCVPHP